MEALRSVTASSGLAKDGNKDSRGSAQLFLQAQCLLEGGCVSRALGDLHSG